MGRACITGVNDLATTFPLLAAEWHPSKNGDLSPSEITSFSSKSVWWICSKGHDWKASAGSRTNNNHKCRLCTNTRNGSLAERFPDTIAIWHPTKNGDITPYDVAHGSKKMYWWQCENGHDVETFPRKVVNGLQCNFCFPKFEQRWEQSSVFLDPEKHPGVEINDVMKYSSDIFHWTCTYNHVWERTKHSHIHHGSTCPECSTSIAAKYPELSLLLHPTKNGNISGYEISVKDPIVDVWWKCENNHEWQEPLANIRARKIADRCFLCKKSVISDDPKKTILYHPDKNGNARKFLSTDTVWWLCGNGHEWQDTRTGLKNKKDECSFCKNSILYTNPELAAFYHLTKNDIDVEYFSQNNEDRVWWQCQNGHEFQRTFRSLKKRQYPCTLCAKSILLTNPEMVAYWHPTKNGTLRIGDVLRRNIKGVWWQCENGHEWFSRDNRMEHDCKDFVGHDIQKSLAERNTDNLVLPIPNSDADMVFWDPDKNVETTPVGMLSYSNEKVHWRCVNGHEWTAGFSHQRNNLKVCKKCELSLLFSNPELAKRWHPTKNGELTPLYVSKGANEKVWWQCENGHEWQGLVSVANAQSKPCKFCLHSPEEEHETVQIKEAPHAKNAVAIVTDTPVELPSTKKAAVVADAVKPVVAPPVKKATVVADAVKPVVAPPVKKATAVANAPIEAPSTKEAHTSAAEIPVVFWDYEKNGRLLPDMLKPSSGEKVFWICSKGHKWLATFSSQRRKTTVCKQCEDALLFVNPELASLWHPTKNMSRTPFGTSFKSTISVWWQCDKGHEWKTSVKGENKKLVHCKDCIHSV